MFGVLDGLGSVGGQPTSTQQPPGRDGCGGGGDRRLRRTLAQVITLADQAPALTDCELRNRLLALASTAR
jgi:hypothetical protein